MTGGRASSLLGLFLVAAGILLLLQTMGIVVADSNLVWSILFILGGLAFLTVLAVERGAWWPAIPGFTLLGIGALMALQVAFPFGAAAFGGSIFLAFLGLGFATVYLIRPANWWAIIPAGTILTLALVASITPFGGRGADGGALFLIGLGLTFVMVYLAPTPRGNMTWALYPAAVLMLLGVIAGATTRYAVNLAWPAILILAGIYLVYRGLRPRRN
jgi:hypothetical protein